MDHPKDKGDRTTLAVILALRAKNFIVSEPFGENARYDLVIEIPVEDLPNRVAGALRVTAPRNGQRKKIRFARDYEIARVALNTDVTEALPSSSGAG